MFRLEWHKRDFAVFSLKAGDSVMPVHNTYLAIYTNLICTVYTNAITPYIFDNITYHIWQKQTLSDAYLSGFGERLMI